MTETLATDTPLTEALKVAVRAYYRGICQYCGAEDSDEVEHIVALSKGGQDTLENVSLACWKCNSRKKARDLDPMFLAIAHARSRDVARKILKLAKPARVLKVKKTYVRPLEWPLPSSNPNPRFWDLMSLPRIISIISSAAKDDPLLVRRHGFILLMRSALMGDAVKSGIPSGRCGKDVLEQVHQHLSGGGDRFLSFGVDLRDDMRQRKRASSLFVDMTLAVPGQRDMRGAIVTKIWWRDGVVLIDEGLWQTYQTNPCPAPLNSTEHEARMEPV